MFARSRSELLEQKQETVIETLIRREQQELLPKLVIINEITEKKHFVELHLGFIDLQTNFIQNIIDSKIVNDWQTIYQERLDMLKLNWKEAKEININESGETIIIDGQRVDMDNVARAALLEIYMNLFQEVFLCYETIDIPDIQDTAALKNLLIQLENSKAIHENKEDELQNAKNIVTMELGEIIHKWETMKPRIINIQKKILANDLLALCEQGDIAKIKACIERQPDFYRVKFVNSLRTVSAIYAKRAPLHAACYHGHFEVVKLLIKYGADPTLPDGSGYTPLHHAVRRQKNGTEIIVYLLDKQKVPVDIKGDYDRTPLHSAAYYNHLEAIQVLLLHGASINAQETEKAGGRTPLHNAAIKGHVEIAAFLLAKGANPQILNTNRDTPLMDAAKAKQIAILEFFFSQGVYLTALQIRILQRRMIKTDRSTEERNHLHLIIATPLIKQLQECFPQIKIELSLEPDLVPIASKLAASMSKFLHINAVGQVQADNPFVDNSEEISNLEQVDGGSCSNFTRKEHSP